MVKVIGSKTCGRCRMVQRMLTNKGVAFEYFDIEQLPQEQASEYIKQAEQKHVLSMPIIFKDDEVISIEEVM